MSSVDELLAYKQTFEDRGMPFTPEDAAAAGFEDDIINNALFPTPEGQEYLMSEQMTVNAKPAFQGEDGQYYSEVTEVVPMGEGFMAMPTINPETGEPYDPAYLADWYKNNRNVDPYSGETLPVFGSEEEAAQYAQYRSENQFNPQLLDDKYWSAESGLEFPNEQGAELSANPQTWRDNTRNDFADFLVNKFGMDPYMAQKTARGIVGDEDAGITDGGIGLSDFTPVGLGFSAQEAYRAYKKAQFNDDKLGMGLAVGELALAGAEAIPGGVIASKVARRGLEKLVDFAGRLEVDPNSVGSLGGNIRIKPADEVELPPAENAQKTQIAGTLPTYVKADGILNEVAPDGATLDYGAGLGLSQKELGYDTYEPFPREGFTPTFGAASEIPDNSYSRITNFNVLNVVPREIRDEIVLDIGRVLAPDGVALITTRGKDVMTAKGTPGPEELSQVTSIGTYQKGFTPTELLEYVTEVLGEGYEVTRLKLGPAGVQIRKIADTVENTPDAGPAQAVLDIRAAQMQLKTTDRIQPSGENPLFDLSPESYEKTLPEQRETYVPRQDAGSNRPLPKNDRGRAVNEAIEKISDRLAERMKPWLGTEAQYFYHTGPIVDKALAMGYSKEQVYDWMREFADAYAATSPRTETAQNIRNATLVMTKRHLGIDLDTIVGPGGEGINEKGYPMMIGRKGDMALDKNGKMKPLSSDGIHRKLTEAVQGDGIDPNTNPKPATFAENVYGNLDGVTVDTHAIRGALDAMNEIDPGSIPIDYIKKEYRDRYKADPLSLDPATMIDDTLASQTTKGESKQIEYAVFSDIYRRAAEKLGVSPAEAQSMGWFGSGDSTGLASELKSVARLLDERIDVTAQGLNKPKEEVFRMLLNKEIPLLQLFATAGGAGAIAASGGQEELARGGFLDSSEAEKGIMSVEGQFMADEAFRLDRAKADLNDDGELSEYEIARGEAVQKAIKNDDAMEAYHGGMACGCDECDGSCGEGMMPGSYYDMDEETGNPVPVGSFEDEVADDIPALLSEGEYVLPADVVRWHGLKHIQDMMMEAKAGLMSMDMMGQLHDTEEPSGEDIEDAEASAEEGYAEEGQGELQEEYETPEGNDVEVASVDTEEEVLDEDEDEEATVISYAFKSTPKVAFIR